MYCRELQRLYNNYCFYNMYNCYNLNLNFVEFNDVPINNEVGYIEITTIPPHPRDVLTEQLECVKEFRELCPQNT